MDLITQGVLGGAVGQALGYRKLGRHAIAWGMVGGIIPDLDVMIRFWGPFVELTHHRGITHSLWFGPVVGLLSGYLLWRFYGGCLKTWISIMVWSLLTHPLLDVFTVYGTQLLAPFSTYRFTIPAVPIIDPLYTVPLAVAIAYGWGHRLSTLAKVRLAAITLGLTTAYVGLAYWQNCRAYALTLDQLRVQGIEPTKVEIFPTMFQIFLRRVVVHATDPQGTDHIRVGFISTWRPRKIQWALYIEKPHPVFQAVKKSAAGQWFRWFTSESILTYGTESLVGLRDLRFGFPGPAIWGLWEIQVVHPTSPAAREVRFCRLPIKVTWQDIKNLWGASFGAPYSPFG